MLHMSVQPGKARLWLAYISCTDSVLNRAWEQRLSNESVVSEEFKLNWSIACLLQTPVIALHETNQFC